MEYDTFKLSVFDDWCKKPQNILNIFIHLVWHDDSSFHRLRAELNSQKV